VFGGVRGEIKKIGFQEVIGLDSNFLIPLPIGKGMDFNGVLTVRKKNLKKYYSFSP
tara:strand:- start:112 stop:279 length:168 start_codon:yes stop_codon:yes gene_type:complete